MRLILMLAFLSCSLVGCMTVTKVATEDNVWIGKHYGFAGIYWGTIYHCEIVKTKTGDAPECVEANMVAP